MRKFLSYVAAFILCLQLIVPVNIVDAATVLTGNKTGTQDGYDYELWKDNGNTSMTLNPGGTFSCSWSNINNALFRKGKKFDSTKTWQQLGNISVDYACNYNPSGNSYLCVYGWTRSPLVEYYIVDSWGTWRPPGASSKGQISVDGGTYDVYETTRVNQPSIDGNTTFKQYWSVRTSKKTSGTISVSKHFEAWTRMGLNLGKMYEVALTVEGYQSSGTANVTKNNITIGGSSSSGDTPVVQPSVAPVVPSAKPANLSEGLYYIKGVGSQKYLQVKGNTASDGQNVEIGTGTGVAGQKWYLANTSDGYVTLKNELGNYMLDIANGADEDGANAQIYSAYSGDPQKFKINATSTNGVYTIVSKGSNGTKALDVSNRGTSDGANVQIYSSNGQTNQQWVFEKVNSTPVASPSAAPSVAPSVKPSVAPSVAPSQSAGTAGLPAGVTCTYSVTSNWGSGFQGQIELKNGSNQSFNNWSLAFETSNKIASLWGADLAGQTGNKVVVKAPSWDANLPAGKTVTINFVADGNGTSAPVNYSLS